MFFIENIEAKAAAILAVNTNKKLNKIKSLQSGRDYELFDYVYGVIRKMDILNRQFRVVRRKSNEFSEIMRKDGNELLAKKAEYQLEYVLEKFSVSIAYAVPESEQLSLAYFDRSRLFFEERFYKECVRDIERALNCNPSDDLKQKLELRLEQVEEHREHHKTFNYHDEVPSLPGSKNKRIQCASRAIGFEINDKWGRHIVAKKDISIGEVLVVEDPYVTCVVGDEQYVHCHECLELCYDLIPCQVCTEAMYCSDVCSLKAFQEYHKYECIIYQHGLKIPRLFVRLALKAVINYESFLADLLTAEEATFRTNRYKDVYTMKNYKELKTPEQLFKAVLEPVAFYHFLTNYTTILDDLHFDDKKIVLKEVLIKNYLNVMNHSVFIEKMQMTHNPSPSHINVASAIYPFYSNFHHSCFCNTVSVYYGSKLVIHAITNIKKGDIITTTFGVFFHNHTMAERKKLLDKYHYKCQCIACENRWPLRNELRPGTPIPKKLETDVMNYLNPELHNRSKGKELLEEVYAFFNQLKLRDTPFKNYMLLRDFIINVLLLMGNTKEPEEQEI